VQCRPPNRPRARRPACSPASSVTDLAFQWAGQPQKLPLPVGAISTAICMALFGPTGVSHANSISIVFAGHLRAHLCDQHTQTDHATCDICSNRPHPMACTVCTRCGLKTSSQYISLFVPPARTVFTFHLSGCPRSAPEPSRLPDPASGTIYLRTSHLLKLYIHSATG